jgi:Flp pilus assembly pilin Flp
MRRLREFLAEEAGQDLIEYSLLIGSIALVAAASILSVGSDSNTLWTVFNNRISGS